MARIRYDIVSRFGGWSIACGSTVGPPYLDQESALRDVNWVAELLEQSGDEVEVYVGGSPARTADSRDDDETTGGGSPEA